MDIKPIYLAYERKKECAMAARELWNLEPPPGFQGLRDDLPLRVYTRHMPHWRQAGATYFVTFRLADSIPESRLEELEGLKSEVRASFPTPRSNSMLQALAKLVLEKVECWLDQGAGSCVLKQPEISQIVNDSLQHFHNERYELGASVIMPNHVHCIIRPLLIHENDLEALLGGLKSFSARRINSFLKLRGQLWQDESYDRIIRNEEHLWRCLKYIGRNPSVANLTGEACRLWINPEWQALGWNLEQ